MSRLRLQPFLRIQQKLLRRWPSAAPARASRCTCQAILTQIGRGYRKPATCVIIISEARYLAGEPQDQSEGTHVLAQEHHEHMR